MDVTLSPSVMIVVSIIAIIVFFVLMFWVVSRAITSGMQKFADKNSDQMAVSPTVVVTGQSMGMDSEEEAEIAAITAAVAMYLGQAPGTFTIKSFRRTGSAWKKAAREEQVYNA